MTRMPLFKDYRAMTIVQKLQRDISKHPLKTGVLGVLTLVMVVFVIKAVAELRPKAATAAVAAVQQSNVGMPVPDSTPVDHADEDARRKESSRLWEKLHELKTTGAGASVAFAFDASFYPPPLIPVQDLHPAAAQTEAPQQAPVAIAMDPEVAKANRIREQSHALVVKSTLIGNGVTPVAVVNQQLLTLGQQILGFEIVAIHSREVEFKKEGVTLSVMTLDDKGSQ